MYPAAFSCAFIEKRTHYLPKRKYWTSPSPVLHVSVVLEGTFCSTPEAEYGGTE